MGGAGGLGSAISKPSSVTHELRRWCVPARAGGDASSWLAPPVPSDCCDLLEIAAWPFGVGVFRTHMLELRTKQRPSIAAVRKKESHESRPSAVGAR